MPNKILKEKFKMKRHAYLIMAHDNFECLEYLLRLIDDNRNDIYLHIDRKVKEFNSLKLRFNKIITAAQLYFTNRIDVHWGTYSQIYCEIMLLKTALSSPHSYYHLLSGSCLPIKTQNEIHDFFNKNEGKEFVSFYRNNIAESNYSKLKYYHLPIGYWRFRNWSILFQKKLHIDRMKFYRIQYMKGSNWFSITHSLAKYIVSKEKEIHRIFCFTQNGDEMFLQTFLYENPTFRKKLWNNEYNDVKYRILHPDYCLSNMRALDWPDSLGTAHPRELVEADFKTLISSQAIFARKFTNRGAN